MGDFPEGGDHIEIGTAVLTLLDATETRIKRVRIERIEPDDL